MLPPPSAQEIQRSIDDMIAYARSALREFYRVNGMTAAPPPRSVTTRYSGGIVFHASPVLAEQEKKRAEMEKRIVPPGVNFTDKPRVSGEMRDRYLEHLREMHAQEYIDLAETEARMSAMMTARTKEELDFLIHDLEPLPEVKDVVKFGRAERKPELSRKNRDYFYFGLLSLVLGWVTPLPGSPLATAFMIVCSLVTAFLWVPVVAELVSRKKNDRKE